MKNILLLGFLAFTSFLQAQNLPAPSGFHFKNPNSILPGRIFGTERETGHNIQAPIVNSKGLQAASLLSIQIIDSLLFWEWDTASKTWVYYQKISDITFNDFNLPKTYTAYYWEGVWTPEVRYVIAFDDNNNIISEIEQTWDGSGWENDYKSITVYDENNNAISVTFQKWDGSEWIDGALHSYTYDHHNNHTSGIIQKHNGINWVNDTYYTVTYDANQNQLSYTLQTWHKDAWTNVGQYLYTYDVNDNLTSNLYQTWNENIWENIIQYLYTYDSENLLSSELSQYWDAGIWSDYARFSFNYNSMDQLIHQFVETWSGSAWENSDYYTYTYDANGNETSELGEVWDGVEWLRSEESAFEYMDTLLLSEVYKYYNDSGDAVEYGDSAYYYFHEITSTSSPADKIAGIHIYPNPASDIVNLICPNENASIHISDLTGRPVLTQTANKGINSIDCKNLPGGIYIVRIGTYELPIHSIDRLMITR